MWSCASVAWPGDPSSERRSQRSPASNPWSEIAEAVGSALDLLTQRHTLQVLLQLLLPAHEGILQKYWIELMR